MEVAICNHRPARPTGLATQRGLDNDVWSLMEDCWKREPTERPTMKGVVARLMLVADQLKASVHHAHVL